ncbi:SNF2 helicase associated domain-containing protein [Fictibacillus iocasae]|uniref:SNF2 helicase associated domain-containing protein n=1 Tax=Fictibacillus iocasae TaxID=2715437 RepID=A0ABW2NSA8_9BACL
MNRKVKTNLIKEMCGIVSFKKGSAFHAANKVNIKEFNEDRCEAIVSGVEDFHVTIDQKMQTSCSCPSLANYQKSCQHVAAVLLAIQEIQQKRNFGVESSSENELTREFLTLFNTSAARSSAHQLHFEKRDVQDVTFILEPVDCENGDVLFGLKLEVGGTKVNDVVRFLADLKRGRPNGIFDPNLNCFVKENDVVMQELADVKDDEREVSPQIIIPPAAWKRLASMLAAAPSVTLHHRGFSYHKLRIVDETPPLSFLLEEKGAQYVLSINGFDRMAVMKRYSSVLFDGVLYQLQQQDGDRLAELKQMLSFPGTNHIHIPHEQIDEFLTHIVPSLKRIGSVKLDSVLSQRFHKTPLVAKLYLDRVKNRLLAGLELVYENVVIQPLESQDSPVAGPLIVRDTEKEETILQLMEESGFFRSDGGYFMQNEELEYEFLFHTVPKLQQLVQLYATTAVRTRIVKKDVFPRIKVKVKKERTNWLEFKFEMTGINDQEIRDMLTALEEKRKYYRLRNGALMSLETREMQEIQRFLAAAPVQEMDHEARLNMPFIQSLSFLDAMDDSSVFTAEESFQQFLEQLRNPNSLDFQVPESLNSVLRDYQKHGFRWMKTLASFGFGGVLADDMGLGKTVQAIAFIVSELTTIRERSMPILIVCPSSLTYNWRNEMMKFAPMLQAVVMDGSRRERENLQRDLDDVDVIITSYSLLRRDISWYAGQTFHTVFFDEAQYFKNPLTQTAMAVKRIQAEHRFGLTGTPVENSIEELWSIYHVVFPQLFKGLKEFSFLQRSDISRRVRPFLLRRKKEDVLSELPDKIESRESTELLPEQKKLYAAYLAKLRHDTLKHLDKETIRKNRIRILAGLTRLRQICCHPSLFVDGYNGSSAKFEQLLQLLEEARMSGRRVLIFSQFTKMLQLIGREMTARGQTYFYLDGATPSEDRLDICNRFNSGERDLFLISLKAGGTGLNLTGADTVILYDLWWNPAVEQQAADRAHRMGQKNTVQVIKLISRGTIEEKMYELQEKKRDLISDMMDGEAGSGSLTEEDIREILNV